MKQWIKANINKIVIVFLMLGPIFDLVTSLSIQLFHISLTWITGIKVLFLALLIYDLHFNSKCRYKNKILIILYTILLYLLIFITITLKNKGFDVLLYEGQNALRSFFFPIVLVNLFALHEEGRLSIRWKYFVYILGVYIFLILLPFLTHTGFHSYAYSKTGSIGWFYSANELGGILSILLPFLFLNLKQKNWMVKCIIFFIIGIVYFSVGTKVPILSLIITFGVFIIYKMIHWIHQRDWKKISVTAVGLLLLIDGLLVFVPKTSFYQNIKIHLEYLEIDSIGDLLNIEHIDHFIYSERIRFLEKTMTNYQQAPIIEKWFGIGYVEQYGTDQLNLKTIEMDYYDIFFRHGIVGSIIYFLPFIIILIIILKKKPNIYYRLSIFLILLISLFSGHILVAPSVSIVVTMVLLGSLEEDKV